MPIPDYAGVLSASAACTNGVAFTHGGYTYAGVPGMGWIRYYTGNGNSGTPNMEAISLFSLSWGTAYDTSSIDDPDNHDDADYFAFNAHGVNWIGSIYTLPIRWRILFWPQYEQRYCSTAPTLNPIYLTDGTAQAVLLPAAGL